MPTTNLARYINMERTEETYRVNSMNPQWTIDDPLPILICTVQLTS